MKRPDLERSKFWRAQFRVLASAGAAILAGLLVTAGQGQDVPPPPDPAAEVAPVPVPVPLPDAAAAPAPEAAPMPGSPVLAGPPVLFPELGHYEPLWKKSLFTTRDLPSPDAPAGPIFTDSLSLSGVYEVDGEVVAVLVDRTTSTFSEARLNVENEAGIKIRKITPGASMDKTRVQLQKGDQAGWVTFSDLPSGPAAAVPGTLPGAAAGNPGNPAGGLQTRPSSPPPGGLTSPLLPPPPAGGLPGDVPLPPP